VGSLLPDPGLRPEVRDESGAAGSNLDLEIGYEDIRSTIQRVGEPGLCTLSMQPILAKRRTQTCVETEVEAQTEPALLRGGSVRTVIDMRKVVGPAA